MRAAYRSVYAIGVRGGTLTKVMDVVVPSMSSRRAEARLGAATGAIAGRGASGAEARGTCYRADSCGQSAGESGAVYAPRVVKLWAAG